MFGFLVLFVILLEVREAMFLMILKLLMISFSYAVQGLLEMMSLVLIWEQLILVFLLWKER
jgi:hypothetical protein